MRWFETPDFDFVRMQKIFFYVSAILIVISLATIFGRGLQYGIDFLGGKEYVMQFSQPAEVSAVRSVLTDALDSQPEVRLYGSDREIMVRTDAEGSIGEVREIIETALSGTFPDNPFVMVKTDDVGPRFAEELRWAALNSVLLSLALIFLYILFRFSRWQYSAGAVIGLAHNVIIVLGVFTLLDGVVSFDVTISQTLIAAFLAIIGYSLNDTIVIFDRIRENATLYKTMEFEPMVNKSLNDTLSRTVITSLTTLFVVTVLFIFGGEVLKGFSLALILGIIIGTYSSLFIASGFVVVMEKRRTAKLQNAK